MEHQKHKSGAGFGLQVKKVVCRSNEFYLVAPRGVLLGEIVETRPLALYTEVALHSSSINIPCEKSQNARNGTERLLLLIISFMLGH